MSKKGDSRPAQFPQKMAASAPFESPMHQELQCLVAECECMLKNFRRELSERNFAECECVLGPFVQGGCCPENETLASPCSLNACRLLQQLLPWTQQCVSPPRGRLESSSRASFKVNFACLPWTLLEDESCGSAQREWEA